MRFGGDYIPQSSFDVRRLDPSLDVFLRQKKLHQNSDRLHGKPTEIYIHPSFLVRIAAAALFLEYWAFKALEKQQKSP